MDSEQDLNSRIKKELPYSEDEEDLVVDKRQSGRNTGKRKSYKEDALEKGYSDISSDHEPFLPNKKVKKNKTNKKKINPKVKKSSSVIVTTQENLKKVESRRSNLSQDPEIEPIDESKITLPIWMNQKYIKDKHGRRPNDPNYDPTSIYIPEEEILVSTPLMKQYYQTKRDHWDKLVAFKVWKFYYFYFNDAIVLHKECDVQIQAKTDKVFCFFHESSMTNYAPILMNKGHRIVIIEQMEQITPGQGDLVKREVCQILTRGTYFENQTMDYSSQFLLAIYQSVDNFGVVFLDSTTHEFHLGQFQDNQYFSNLRTLLSKIKPIEVIFLKDTLNLECLNMLRNQQTKPALTPVTFENYPKRLSNVFDEFFISIKANEDRDYKLPFYLEQIKSTIENLVRSDDDENGIRLKERQSPHYYTLQAFSLVCKYLDSVLLGETVLKMGNFFPYDFIIERNSCLHLDSQALENLEVMELPYVQTIFENHSLFGYMDYTKTSFGKRMLKRWITVPTLDVNKINERLDAIDDLTSNPNALEKIQSMLGSLPDLERTCSRIYNLINHRKLSAQYTQNLAKNALEDFLKYLDQLKKVEHEIEKFEDLKESFKCDRLYQLITFRDVDIELFKKKKIVPKKTYQEGLFPRIKNIIEDLEKTVIKDQYELIRSRPSVHPRLDEICNEIIRVRSILDKILQNHRNFYKSNSINLVYSKQKFEIEFPENLVEGSKRPKDFLLTSKRTGYLRFLTPEIEGYNNYLFTLEGEYQHSLVDFILGLFKTFYQRKVYWLQVISCLSELDCLCSMATLASKMPHKCRPQVLPIGGSRIFELKGVVHPCLIKSNPKFVSNDIIQDEESPIFLITGPNMGGKSTLLRQAGIAIIMAQSGSYVPGDSFKFTAVDRIFTRIGGNDRLAEGKSTFFVEMEEAQAILNESTSDSFLIIDELGRGTGTYDGLSLAYAFLKYVATKKKCMAMFATHYHMLVEEFKFYKNITNYYMKTEIDEKRDKLKFLYKFIKGVANKSYGIIIAKHAGIPDEVVQNAKTYADLLTKENKDVKGNYGIIASFNHQVEQLINFIKNDKNVEEVLTNLDI